MSEENKKIMDKKARKKEDKKLAKKYIKAQYNYRIGYIFKSINQFFKQHFVYYFKKYNKIIMGVFIAISLILIISGTQKMIQGHKMKDDIQAYNKSNEDLEGKAKLLQSDIKKDNERIDKASISTQSGVKRGKETIDKIFKGMYEYDNATDYKENREANLNYFENPKAKWIAKVYSDDKDSDGNSQIETLGLRSELDNVDIYTESVDDTSKKVVPFKVVTSYTGYIDNISSDYATRTHYTTYKIDVDTSNNKVTNMKKINTVKVNNEIS